MRFFLPSIPTNDSFPNILLSTFWHSLLNPSLTWKTGGFIYSCFSEFLNFWGISNTASRRSFLISLPYLSPRGVQHHLFKSINKRNDIVSSLWPSDPLLALIVFSTQKTELMDHIKKALWLLIGPMGALQEIGGKEECDVGIFILPIPTLRWAMLPQPKSQILSQVFYTALSFGIPLSISSFYFFGPNLVTALMFPALTHYTTPFAFPTSHLHIWK